MHAKIVFDKHTLDKRTKLNTDTRRRLVERTRQEQAAAGGDGGHFT